MPQASAPFSGMLTRKQQWRRLEGRRPLHLPGSSSPPLQTASKQKTLQDRATCTPEQHHQPQRDCSMDDRDRPTHHSDPRASQIRSPSTARRHSGVRYAKSTSPADRKHQGSKCDLQANPGGGVERHGDRQRSASMPLPVTNVDGEAESEERQTRGVSFDRCVRVVLVPSRRDLDPMTAHEVWWGREDAREFRCAAYRFRQQHGTLSGVSDEELEDCGPPPGMPRYASARKKLSLSPTPSVPALQQ